MSVPKPRPVDNGVFNLGLAVPSIIFGRLLLGLTGIPVLLKYNQQLSSAPTSHSNLFPLTGFGASILWALCDALGAWALVQIWRARQRVSTSSRDVLVATIYLLNPYIILPSIAHSTAAFENTLMLLSLMFASQGRASASLVSLALLVHLSLSSILVLVPLLLVLLLDPASRLASPKPLTSYNVEFRRLIPLLGEFIIDLSILTIASTFITGGWVWIPQTWGASMTLPDLTPNTGLWWYFFTEMFDHFRPFFLMVFSVHLLIYIAPICIKFQYDPLYATFLLIGILGTFKAYPTLSDPGLFLSMIAIFPEIYPYFRHPMVTALLHLHAVLLMPLFNHLWLNQGTGNANFYYASTLVFACSNGAALVDCIWAGLRIAIGEEREGYAVVQE
ncbi:hypothetical protein H0H81_012593 [Sphagnurus paluster]|uniref:PIG-U-domain-containing protein n=1 Tax=Sphagnurus paluster TaxID=117069 RepID=A0A9P7KKU0_9AGAR|nr:hypothetical protein H0H81_012593 [Sphagnurus paluster]